MMFDDKTLAEIIRSLEAECAKALAELDCANNDLRQAQARLKFLLAAVHYMKTRI